MPQYAVNFSMFGTAYVDKDDFDTQEAAARFVCGELITWSGVGVAADSVDIDGVDTVDVEVVD